MDETTEKIAKMLESVSFIFHMWPDNYMAEFEPEREVVTFSHFGDDLSLKYLAGVPKLSPTISISGCKIYTSFSTFFSYFPILGYSEHKL